MRKSFWFLTQIAIVALCIWVSPSPAFADPIEKHDNNELSHDQERIITLAQKHSSNAKMLLDYQLRISNAFAANDRDLLANALQDAVSKFEQSGNSFDFFHIFFDLGLRFGRIDDFSSSERFHLLALEHAEKSGIEMAQALSLAELGTQYLITNRLEKARIHFVTALEIAEKRKDEHLIGVLKFRIGRLITIQGQAPGYAAVFLKDAATLLKKTGDASTSGSAELFLAQLILESSSTISPEKIEEAHKLSEGHVQSDNPTNQVIAHTNLAKIAQLQSLRSTKKHYLNEALRIALANNLTIDAIIVSNELGYDAKLHNNVADACSYWQDSLNIASSALPPPYVEKIQQIMDAEGCAP